MAYKYKMVRLICKGIIKNCSNCENQEIDEGYCSLCGRPLWRKSGEVCDTIIGYLEKPSDGIFKKQGKVHLKCTICNSMMTI